MSDAEFKYNKIEDVVGMLEHFIWIIDVQMKPERLDNLSGDDFIRLRAERRVYEGVRGMIRKFVEDGAK